MAVWDLVAGVPAGGVANAAEAAVAGGDMGGQHRLDRGAERQICEADDAGAGARLAVAAARRHGGGAIDEFGLADDAQLGRPVGAGDLV